MGAKARPPERGSVFIVVCLSRCEGESRNFLVKGRKGNVVFKSMAAAEKAVASDMREYAKAERESGYRCRIVHRHLEWTGSDEESLDREAKWYIYMVDPGEAA